MTDEPQTVDLNPEWCGRIAETLSAEYAEALAAAQDGDCVRMPLARFQVDVWADTSQRDTFTVSADGPMQVELAT